MPAASPLREVEVLRGAEVAAGLAKDVPETEQTTRAGQTEVIGPRLLHGLRDWDSEPHEAAARDAWDSVRRRNQRRPKAEEALSNNLPAARTPRQSLQQKNRMTSSGKCFFREKTCKLSTIILRVGIAGIAC